jgi:hypothetical protein
MPDPHVAKAAKSSPKAGRLGRDPSSGASKRLSQSVLHLGADQAGSAKAIGSELLSQRGISSVDIDILRRAILVEYDPDQISFEVIRSIIGGRRGTN